MSPSLRSGQGWWAIDVRVAGWARQEFAAWLVELTGQAVEEREDGTIVTFAPDRDSADQLTSAIAKRDRQASISRRQLEENDWSVRWRDGLGARRLGRLVIVPSWIPHTPEDNEAVVVIDPETAFGSGEHGSTRAALTLLERHLKPGDRVLDLGSGSGILTIAAVRLGAARAVGLEVDAEAIPVAQKNAARNEVLETTEFVTGDACILAPLLGPVDLICSNILRIINEGLFPEIRMALRDGGRAIFSGMEVGESGLFRPALEAAGFKIVAEAVDGDWWAVMGEKR